MPFNAGRAVGYLDLDTTGFKKGFKSAMQDIETFKSQTATVDDKMSALSNTAMGVGKSMTKGVTAPLVGLGTAAVGVFAKFESSMSQVQATMGITANSMVELKDRTVSGSEAMEMLEKAARDAGATTKFSASESAEALNYLALAGFDVEKSISALPSILNLAAAGGLELGYASDVVTDSMSALGIGIEDLDKFVDQLARTSSKSNTNVAQLGEALLAVGATAKIVKGGITETNTVLGILADNGTKGAEGGTRLRNILLSLSAPVDTAKAKLDELGVSAYDQQGNFRSLEDTFADLKNALSDLSLEEQQEALRTIFNVTDLGDVNYLLGVSSERWEELGSSIEDSAGAAQQMADTQLDNLSGQLEIIKSSLTEVALSMGELLIPYFKKFAEFIQKVLDNINGMDEGTKKMIVIFGVVVAAIGPLLITIANLITAFRTIATVLPLVKVAFSAIGGPITLIMGLISGLIVYIIHLYNTNEEFRNKVTAVWNAVGNFVSSSISKMSAVLSNLVSYYKNAAANIKTAWNELTTWFKSKVNDFANIGKNIVSGLWNGILSAKDELISKVKGFVEDIKNVFTCDDGFDINSPSKWAENVWAMVDAGFAKKMNANESEAVRKATEYSQAIMQAATKFVEDKKFYNDITLEDEIAFWKEMLNNRKLSSEDLEQINKNIYSAEKQLQEELERQQKETLEEQERFAKEYSNAIESRKTALGSFAGLFDEVTKKEEVSGKTLVDNLRSQIDAFKEWQENMAKLEKKGVSGALLEELKKMGPSAAEEIEALSKLSERELNKYQRMFEEKMRLIGEQAKLDVDTKMLKEGKSLEELMAVGAEMTQGISEGIGENAYLVETPISELIAVMKGKVEDSKDDIEYSGRSIFNYFLSGLKQAFPSLEAYIEEKVEYLQDQLRRIQSLIASIKKASKESEESSSSSSSSVSGYKYASIVVDGSHAGGLSYVPYDGYVAELHEGERVLTKEENSNFRSGRSGGGDTFIFNSPKAITPVEARRQMKKAKRDLEGGFA